MKEDKIEKPDNRVSRGGGGGEGQGPGQDPRGSRG